jgi:hypothetical protein
MMSPSWNDVASADLRQRLRAAGAGVQGSAEDDQAILAAGKKAGYEMEDADDLPAIIPFEPTHSKHQVKITDREGFPVTLDLVLTWGAIDEASWYRRQIAKTEVEMLEEDDKALAFEYAAKLRDFKRDLLQLFVPDLPQGLLARLDPAQHDLVWVAIRRMELDGQAVVINAQKKMLAPYYIKKVNPDDGL